MTPDSEKAVLEKFNQQMETLSNQLKLNESHQVITQ